MCKNYHQHEAACLVQCVELQADRGRVAVMTYCALLSGLSWLAAGSQQFDHCSVDSAEGKESVSLEY